MKCRNGVYMDPVAIGAVLLAAITGASEALGGQLWSGVVSLVRRPLHHRTAAGKEVAVSSGEAELAALQQAPADKAKAVALAGRLLERAAADGEFSRALQQWWEHAAPVRDQFGVTVTNTISGGSQQGPVLQGQSFTNITFGAPGSPHDPGSADGR